MMRSIYTGRSGIKNHQTRMDVVGNNISNVNTVGFKSGRATFSDMLSQTIKGATAANGTVGSTNPKQIGLGVGLGSVDTIFTNGAPLVTDKNTDLCLSGDGLFIVKKGNETFYTRYGAFDFDGAGNYVMPGSGHIVQGWMASDGVINPTGAAGDITIEKGKVLSAKSTDLVSYYYNLGAQTPLITGISGGKQVTTTILVDDVSKDNPLPLSVTFGGKSFQYSVVGLSDNMFNAKKWKVKEDVLLGATSMDLINEDGETVKATIYPEANFEVPQGTAIGVPINLVTKSSVTEKYPLLANIDGKKYTVIGIDRNLDLSKEWSVKYGGASVGSNTITITDGTNDIVLTLKTPLEESIGKKQIMIEKTSTVATPDGPTTLTLSDGSVITVTEGTYSLGSSIPVATTMTVYDSTGEIHKIPLYFTRKGSESANTWIVSLTKDTSVTKGEATTPEIINAKGENETVSFNAAEIQFDAYGNLITNDGSDTTGILSLSGQNITVDFTAVTQFAGSTTINSSGNGYAEGTLQDLQVDSSGVITGTYSNGVLRPEAQVALAHFSNAAGLFKTGTNLYKVSSNSGNPEIIKVGDFGTVITPGALEMSNVNIASEFADMIITQRGFQSNSKLITVGDEMLETAVNMKR